MLVGEFSSFFEDKPIDSDFPYGSFGASTSNIMDFMACSKII